MLGTAKNDADGKVSFTREFQLSDLGGAVSKDFTYTIVEQPGAEAGMVYDNHPLTYKVTVTDGGAGSAEREGGRDEHIRLRKPSPTPTSRPRPVWPSDAQKRYVKKDDNTPIVLKGGEFTFDVYEGNLTAEQLAGASPSGPRPTARTEVLTSAPSPTRSRARTSTPSWSGRATCPTWPTTIRCTTPW